MTARAPRPQAQVTSQLKLAGRYRAGPFKAALVECPTVRLGATAVSHSIHSISGALTGRGE